MPLTANVVRENLRNRVLYLLAAAGVLFMLALLAGQGGKVTTTDGRDLLSDPEGVMRVGFGMINVFGSLVTVMLAMSTIPREYERQTIHLLLVRPVARWELATSFLAGNILTAWLFLVLMWLPLFAGLAARGGGEKMPLLLLALPALALNTANLAGLTTLLSSRLPGPAAAFFGLVLYGLGAFGTTLSALAGVLHGLRGALLRALLVVLPPVDAVATETAKLFGAGAAIDWRVYAGALLYLWAVGALAAVSLYGREA